MSERVLCDDPGCERVFRRGSLTGQKYIRPHYVDEHPATSNPGQTHYEGCERTAGHHGCALARVADLEQDRSDLWRCLGIPQDASVDAAIAKVIEIRATERDDHSFRMLCDVVNLRGDMRYDLSAVMGEIERMQEASRAARAQP